MEIKKDILWRSISLASLAWAFLLWLSSAGSSLSSTSGRLLAQHVRQPAHRVHGPGCRPRHHLFEEGRMLSTSIPYFDIRIDFGADGLRDQKSPPSPKKTFDSSPPAWRNFSWTNLRQPTKTAERRVQGKGPLFLTETQHPLRRIPAAPHLPHFPPRAQQGRPDR